MSAEGAAPVGGDDKNESGMIRAMLRLLVAVGCGAFVILGVIVPLSLRHSASDPAFSATSLVLEGILLTAVALSATWGLYVLLRKLEPLLNANALSQAQFLDKLDARYVDVAIVFAAALSLFLELALIRWQSSVLIFLAFYKNFSLLACFAAIISSAMRN